MHVFGFYGFWWSSFNFLWCEVVMDVLALLNPVHSAGSVQGITRDAGSF
jgi:hypothetical protein